MQPADVDALFTRLQATAAPVTDVTVKQKSDPFRSLVACLLSAQSRDANTALATARLFDAAATPEAILALPEAEIARLIRPSGLYNTKARNLHRLCRALVHDHGGIVPTTREGLMALPGIGRKCADIMLRFTYGQPAVAVDTHVFRVARRLGLSAGASEARVARDLDPLVPARFKMAAHLLLLDHGKTVCRARVPRCAACAVLDLCPRIGVAGRSG
ncbi:MAG: endonuclease III domain-containing protein [Pseudomonadota bacterium]